MTVEMTKTDIQQQWTEISCQLKDEIGDVAFDSWVKPLNVSSFNKGNLEIAVPTRFMKNWVLAHYSQRIQKIWEKKNPDLKKLEFIVQHTAQDNHNTDSSLMKKISNSPSPLSVSAEAKFSETSVSGETGDLSVPLNPHFTFDSFVVGKANEFAYAAAKKVAEMQTTSFNPLFLYSGVGQGKTHLMHAIAWEIKKNNPNINIVYLSAEKFMYRFVRALRYKNTAAFKEQFRSVDVLMVDDVQFMGGKEGTQEEFFHTFNSLIEEGRKIIISADKSPVDLDGIETKLKSRLSCGLVADIHNSDFELRSQILENKAKALGTELPKKVCDFLANKITSNIRELEGALRRVIAHCQLLNQPQITLETTQDVLKDMLRAYDKTITIEEIQKKVAAYFGISTKEMASCRRCRSIARPRQIAMYLAKNLTSRSLPDIGVKFGRDHTTVMHAIKKIEELLGKDQEVKEAVDALQKSID